MRVRAGVEHLVSRRREAEVALEGDARRAVEALRLVLCGKVVVRRGVRDLVSVNHLADEVSFIDPGNVVELKFSL